MNVITAMTWASWQVFQDAALYILLGFFVAGIMHVYLRPESVARYFRRGRFRSVFIASLFGIPIPL
jgi:uncharacterized membrane protein YraQ (UPF0718 family)